MSKLPGGYSSLDAGYPWLIYWITNVISLCKDNYAINHDNKLQLVKMLKELQHEDGGFCGTTKGHAHLISSYAAVIAIVNLNIPGDGFPARGAAAGNRPRDRTVRFRGTSHPMIRCRTTRPPATGHRPLTTDHRPLKTKNPPLRIRRIKCSGLLDAPRRGHPFFFKFRRNQSC